MRLMPYGASPGEGNSHGKKFGGIVEDLPVIWISWISCLCKELQIEPAILNMKFYGKPLTITSVLSGFGTRYYWLCPECGRRCEAIYNNGDTGCRECLHLGYRSQVHRKNSFWSILCRVQSRDWDKKRRKIDNDVIAKVIASCQDLLKQRLEEKIINAIEIN